MKIEIFLKRETHFGDPVIRCLIDENSPFFDGASQDYICAEFGIAPGYHELVITHYNKKDTDHEFDKDGHMVKDKHVEIQRIIIDDLEFSIDELREGHFYPVYNPEYRVACMNQGVELPPSISPNLYLGHNGTWKLQFYTPFVEYLIKKRKHKNIKIENTIFQSDVELLKQAKAWLETVPDIEWKI